MSQAQVNYAQLPSSQAQATTSTATTPQPTTSTTTYQTASTSQTNSQGPNPLVATSSSSTLPTSTQQTTSSSSQTTNPHSRSAAELARKDRTLADFMLMLDDHEPLVRDYSLSPVLERTNETGIQIPNEVTDYYLQRVGFECEDVRL